MKHTCKMFEARKAVAGFGGSVIFRSACVECGAKKCVTLTKTNLKQLEEGDHGPNEEEAEDW